MTGTLARYLGTRFLLMAVGTVLLLAALVQILDLLDTAEDILATGQGAEGFAHYVALRLPSILPEVLPLGMLLGALFLFASLMRNAELVALRAAGFSIAQVLIALLPAAVLLALAHYGISDTLRPRTERLLAQWWAENSTSPDENKPVWLKVDDLIVEIGKVRDEGRRLERISIFRRDGRDAIVSRTLATAANYRGGGGWTLENPSVSNWGQGQISAGTPGLSDWNTRLRPRDILTAMVPDATISAGAAYQTLVGQRLAIASPPVYATALQRAFAQPIGDLVMLLLAAPLAFANWRAGGSGRVFLSCLGAGLLFILTDGVVATLGRAGLLPPIIAAWGPPLAFGLLALFMLDRLQRGRAPAGIRP